MAKESRRPRIGIVVVAYNAAKTLERTLDRIPEHFRHRVTEVIVCDDASADETFEIGRRWAMRSDTPVTHVIRHTKNLGYGGNQKSGYRLAIDHDLDIVVLLHGDGQYAPEYLPELVAPFESEVCSAVFGSRMMTRGSARKGGMPLYKWIGNRILTSLENRVLRTDLTEFHSGYRAYSTEILRAIPFEANSDGFDFDTQIIAQVVHAGGTITEVPIPTFYGDEICYVNGLAYARDVVKDVVEYRMAVSGFGTSDWVPRPDTHEVREDDGSSHAEILDMLSSLPPSRVLVLGCLDAGLVARMKAEGHYLVGVGSADVRDDACAADEFHVADLNDGLPGAIGTRFDVVVAGDVIEHLVRPERALHGIRTVLRPGGQVLLSVPNFGHWYPRLRTAFGGFGYDRRGILDETHLRFFTRSTLRRLVRRAGYDVVEERVTGLPVRVVTRGANVALLERLDRFLVRLRPTLFGYQNILRLTPHAEDIIVADLLPLRRSDEDQSYASTA